jgi:hypothetical protein
MTSSSCSKKQQTKLFPFFQPLTLRPQQQQQQQQQQQNDTDNDSEDDDFEVSLASLATMTATRAATVASTISSSSRTIERKKRTIKNEEQLQRVKKARNQQQQHNNRRQEKPKKRALNQSKLSLVVERSTSESSLPKEESKDRNIPEEKRRRRLQARVANTTTTPTTSSGSSSSKTAVQTKLSFGQLADPTQSTTRDAQEEEENPEGLVALNGNASEDNQSTTKDGQKSRLPRRIYSDSSTLGDDMDPPPAAPTSGNNALLSQLIRRTTHATKVKPIIAPKKWKVPSWVQLETSTSRSKIAHLCWDPMGVLLAVATADKTIAIYDWDMVRAADMMGRKDRARSIKTSEWKLPPIVSFRVPHAVASLEWNPHEMDQLAVGFR